MTLRALATNAMETLETDRQRESIMGKSCRSNGFGVGSQGNALRLTRKMMRVNDTAGVMSKIFSLNKLRKAQLIEP